MEGGGGRGEGGVELFTDKVYTYMCVALCILAVYWRGRDWKAIQKSCQRYHPTGRSHMHTSL